MNKKVLSEAKLSEIITNAIEAKGFQVETFADLGLDEKGFGVRVYAEIEYDITIDQKRVFVKSDRGV